MASLGFNAPASPHNSVNCRYSHLVNAGKYLSSAAAVSLTAAMKIANFYNHSRSLSYLDSWHPVILAVLVFRTGYTILWDILMDWALMRKNPKAPLLRPVLLYSPLRYYVAIITNTVARCLWVFTLQSTWCYAGCSFMFTFVEVFRRGQWTVYRMEHQYLRLIDRLDEDEAQHGNDHMSMSGKLVSPPRLAGPVSHR